MLTEQYYVIYDLYDNLECFILNIDELSLYTGLRKKDINYKFKNTNNDYILYRDNNVNKKIYCFN